LIKKFKQGYRQITEDEPGHRFLNAHKRWKGSNEGTAVAIAIIISAILLIMTGAVLSLVPGIPGILLGLPGLVMIATRFRRVAVWLDWIELNCRKIAQKFRRRRAPH